MSIKLSTKEKDKKYIAHTYNRYDIHIVSGSGSLLKDENGKKYIDMGSGIGVNSFGIADKIWQKAIKKQIKLVQHTSNLYYTSPCADLAEILCNRTGMSRVFFSNSGAEANECAIKIARKYAAEKKGPEYYNIITINNSFHGRTLTTLAATAQDVFHSLYNPLTPGFISVEANDTRALERALSENKCAAVLLECVQGESGVLPLSPDYIRFVRQITQSQDVLMMIDEVQTGNGRCGELYAYMNFGITPDVVSTAKGLAGGLPLGATLMAQKCQDVFSYSDHGSTFGGNPVACSAAISIINRIDDKLLEQVRRKSEYIFSNLRGSKGCKSISGLGLMIGIECQKPLKDVVGKCIENGVLPLTAKSKLRLLPPLNIPFPLLEKAVSAIKSALA